MKLLSRAILISLATCTTHLAVANDYQSFTSINYNSTSTGAVDNDSYGIGSTYYFDKKSSLGPLNEFDYINTVSNVSADAEVLSITVAASPKKTLFLMWNPHSRLI